MKVGQQSHYNSLGYALSWSLLLIMDLAVAGYIVGRRIMAPTWILIVVGVATAVLVLSGIEMRLSQRS
jgi:hypothetical protein